MNRLYKLKHLYILLGVLFFILILAYFQNQNKYSLGNEQQQVWEELRGDEGVYHYSKRYQNLNYGGIDFSRVDSDYKNELALLQLHQIATGENIKGIYVGEISDIHPDILEDDSFEDTSIIIKQDENLRKMEVIFKEQVLPINKLSNYLRAPKELEEAYYSSYILGNKSYLYVKDPNTLLFSEYTEDNRMLTIEYVKK
ncbi:hypothetical protein HZY91_03245 [Facklamia sp. DSM 111018]|uniref:Uncharacterized protein n=1 Tax=Facklamia lactis TaxID=2749967 RepID=A0ABS0LPK1_9LACT|nr:hypothetical protein [Facklamia lactis]MBG9980105.1 hypothetical protein [Facklamia lactis]MBG9985907.1 hypothetical protein [Facklamia lactis]